MYQEHSLLADKTVCYANGIDFVCLNYNKAIARVPTIIIIYQQVYKYFA